MRAVLQGPGSAEVSRVRMRLESAHSDRVTTGLGASSLLSLSFRLLSRFRSARGSLSFASTLTLGSRSSVAIAVAGKVSHLLEYLVDDLAKSELRLADRIESNDVGRRSTWHSTDRTSHELQFLCEHLVRIADLDHLALQLCELQLFDLRLREIQSVGRIAILLLLAAGFLELPLQFGGGFLRSFYLLLVEPANGFESVRERSTVSLPRHSLEYQVVDVTTGDSDELREFVLFQSTPPTFVTETL